MGGAERVTRTIAREAARSGNFDRVDCFVLCWSRTGTLDALEDEGNVHLHYTLASSERGGILALLGFLRRWRYDLVFSSHTHMNALCSLTRGIGLLRTRRLISRESTTMFERKFKRAGPIFRAMYRLYGNQDLIICQTDRMRQSLDKNTAGRFRRLLRTLPNPIDIERVEAGRQMDVPPALSQLGSDRTLIGWCGRLSDVKNPLGALDVLRSLHDTGREDMHMVMIGDGPMSAESQAYATSLNLQGHVTFTGYMANPVPALAKCDLGLVTSEIEGFPNVVLEMLAAGIKGIATTNCAGGLDMIPSVHISESGTAQTLAEALTRIATSDQSPLVARFLEERKPAKYLIDAMGVG
jgi:glycosyltransferase involved in cell wall biosynthesis